MKINDKFTKVKNNLKLIPEKISILYSFINRVIIF